MHVDKTPSTAVDHVLYSISSVLAHQFFSDCICLSVSDGFYVFISSFLSPAHTVRWLAQPWAAIVKAVHFATTTYVLLKQVSVCITAQVHWK